MPCVKVYDIWHFIYFTRPISTTYSSSSSSSSSPNIKSYILFASQMMSGFVEQEETSVMESPKRESSEWTDEKHSLYLKSMEASFVNQLYNSLDMRSWQTQNECSSMSDMRRHASTRSPSGQFKVLQNGSWSRVDFKRENYARNGNNRPDTSSSNPWIQHFRNGNGHRDAGAPSSQERPLTSFSNTEVTDQNFVQEVPDIQTVNASGSKRRKSSSKVSEYGNDQAASFWHVSCDGNR